MSDITPITDEVIADKAPAPVTFIIMRDALHNPGAPDPQTAPAFVVYVTLPAPGYEDIDPEAYGARRAVLNQWFDAFQPDDVVGRWWVGKMPADGAENWDAYLDMRPFTVNRTITISY